MNVNHRLPVSGMAPSAPKPCAKFKRMPLSPKFIEHLPNCDACKAVVVYLSNRNSICFYKNRN